MFDDFEGPEETIDDKAFRFFFGVIDGLFYPPGLIFLVPRQKVLHGECMVSRGPTSRLV